ncbi:MAG: hypothetical protein IT385_27140 [Deltaproteobacteria bacterium]|nr:hypothetical protein [Deltaproteobacteria bacterium]
MDPPLEARLARWWEEALALATTAPDIVRALVSLVAPDDNMSLQAELRLTTDVSTAALGWDDERRRFVVAIGVDMLARELRDPADLLYLVCHELIHLVRGEHTLPPGRLAIAMNLAADALNDAWLTGPALAGFFSPTSSLPARRSLAAPTSALLLPLPAAAERVGEPGHPLAPRVSRALFERVVAPPMTSDAASTPYDPRAWADVHHALQIGGRDDALELEVAVRLVLPLLDQLPTPPPSRAPLSSAALAALAALRRALGDAAGAVGPAATRVARTTTDIAAGVPSRRLERFVRRFASSPTSASEAWRPRGPETRAADQGARLHRRPLVEWAAGARASPFAVSEPSGGIGVGGVELYLDASASMWSELPPIVATIVRRCADVLALPPRLFSIGVHPIGLAALGSGRLPSDVGTDMRALAEDLLARGVRRAVVVSDGAAPPLPARTLEALRLRGVVTALVFPGEAPRACPLDGLCPQGARLALGLGARRR